MAEPGYQRSVSGSGKRLTPDVAFDGDPNTGVEVYQTSPYTGIGSWQIVGGTSLGTPAWAAIIAIADQGRALAGKGSLDGPTQTLPTLYSLPPSDFHAVASYRPGHAAMMGLGSPDGPPLIADLVASNISVPLRISSSRAAARAVHIRKARLKAVVAHHRPSLAAHAHARPTIRVAHPRPR